MQYFRSNDDVTMSCGRKSLCLVVENLRYRTLLVLNIKRVLLLTTYVKVLHEPFSFDYILQVSPSKCSMQASAM